MVAWRTVAACGCASALPCLFTGVDHVSYTECCSYGRIAANDTALFFRFPKLIFPLAGDEEIRKCVLDAAARHGADLKLVDG